jgi:aspartyl-tRNA(Asn)/glutamyl-tRNA(Gln) amidotransferase subunit A
MTTPPWTIRGLQSALASRAVRPSELAAHALDRSNSNAGHNTYLWQDHAWTLAEAARAEATPRPFGGDGPDHLWGLPISVKDCFDLAGAPTSCGLKFYRDLNGPAQHDSWLVKRLRAAGAVITGKTHLHPLAYGITGENPEFGDCVQPGNPTALTGGSSSGAAASVLEGSAVAAIGTDTGGSIRVPAALCGLAGYRASHGRGNWRGAAHLAQSFDTMGWLFRDLEDGPSLASLFARVPIENDEFSEVGLPLNRFKRIAIVDDTFLHDCEPEIIASLYDTLREFEALQLISITSPRGHDREYGTIQLQSSTVNVDWWTDSFQIFAPIQAWEAARIHAGHFEHFEPSIRERLEWGARITPDEIAALRQRHQAFRERMDELLAEHDLLILPAAPVSSLPAGANHSQTRKRLLRYTTPFSLAGVPVVTIPCKHGGMQLAAARGNDEALLQLAASLGAQRNAAPPPPDPQ